MLHVTFAATDYFDIKQLYNLDLFCNNYSNFQSAYCKNNAELEILLQLMGFPLDKWVTLQNSPFLRYSNISKFTFPEFSESEYKSFFEIWIPYVVSYTS